RCAGRAARGAAPPSFPPSSAPPPARQLAASLALARRRLEAGDFGVGDGAVIRPGRRGSRRQKPAERQEIAPCLVVQAAQLGERLGMVVDAQAERGILLAGMND